MSWKSAVFHNPSGWYIEDARRSDSELEAWSLGSEMVIRLRTPLNAPLNGAYLRWTPDGEQQMLAGTRLPAREGWHCDWWEFRLRASNARLVYRFYLTSHDSGGWWYTQAGIARHVPTDHFDFQVMADDYQAPRWVEQTVFYQIFPDRFCDGDPSNNVRSGGHQVEGKPAVARVWGELPDVHQGGREFFGGDIQGITARLDYLQETLGVTALYLNPIGTAPSSHKYDVASYTQVDPHFGGNAAFQELSAALQERGMRIILDIVPNHCGEEHPWFRLAQREPQAETREYFSFVENSDDYECWLGVRSLPKLDYRSHSLRQVMYEAPQAVMRQWLRPPYSIHGWRIDVANMLARGGAVQLGHKVMRGMRRAVKQENPQAYLLGENFFDASNSLQGDELDATMNYRGFMMPLYHWLTGVDYNAVFERAYADRFPLSGQELAAQWQGFRSPLPWRIQRQQFNLLDSHDTPRLLNLVGGDRKLAATARLVLFTYPGVPSIYYGDEVGVEGGRDPDNRRCFPWDSPWDEEWLDGWQRLVKLRKQSRPLAGGAFQVLLSQEHTLAFVRETSSERLLVVARRGDDQVDSIPVHDGAIPDGACFSELFSGTEARVENGRLPIPGSWTQAWIQL